MLIKDIVKLKPFTQVIDFQSTNKELIQNYVILDETAAYFQEILEGFSLCRDDDTTDEKGIIEPQFVPRCHKITGTYGVGKSYFLLILKTMLSSLNDSSSFADIRAKFSNFPRVLYQLDRLSSDAKKYIIVNINGKSFGELSFKEVVERQVISELNNTIGKEKLKFDNFFTNAANMLKEWKKKSSPIYNQFSVELSKEIDMTCSELIQALEDRDNAAKEHYINLYRAIIGDEPKGSFETMSEFLVQCNDNVQNNGYSGMVILFDEFSAYLRNRAEIGYFNNDLSSIDILGECTYRTNSLIDLHFITTEHEDIEKILKKHVTDLEAIKKTKGRFTEHSLFFDKGSKLIADLLVKKDESALKDLLQKHLDIVTKFRQVKPENDVFNLYPLSPFAVDYLIRVSENYAQHDRTAFSFMDDEAKKFINQAEVEKDSKLNLIGVEVVFDHFKEKIFLNRDELVIAYNKEFERADNAIQKDLVKLFVLDYAISVSDLGKTVLKTTIEQIKYMFMLSDKEIDDVKNFLHREANDPQSYIIKNSLNGNYELTPDVGSINIEDELEKEIANTDENKMIQRLISNRANMLDIRSKFTMLKAKDKFPFERLISGKHIKEAGQLESINFKKEAETLNYHDSKLLFYIPQPGQLYDVKKIYNIANSKRSEMVDNTVCIAIPKNYHFDNSETSLLLNKFEAAERLSKNEDIMSNNKATNDLRQKLVSLRNQVYTKISEFGRAENFVFFFKDEVVDNVKNINLLIENWMLEKLYYKFPKIEREDFSSRGSSNPLLQRLIIPGKAEKVDLNSTSVFCKHIIQTLKPWDLVDIKDKVGGADVSVKLPQKNDSIKEIFSIFALPDKQKSLSDKYEILLSSPWGLNDPIIETLFAIFMKTNEKYYLEDIDNRRIQITQESVERFWSQNYKLCETQDVVEFELKQDLVNILQLIDSNFVGTSAFRKINANMPSDDFGQTEVSSIITNYTNTVANKIEVFINNFRQIVDDKSLNKELSKIKSIKDDFEKINNILRPVDIIKSISKLIDDYFDNNVSVKSVSSDSIDERYYKLQNFFDNIKWLDENLDAIRKLGSDIKKINAISSKTDVSVIKDMAYKANKVFDDSKNGLFNNKWLDEKYGSIFDKEKIFDDYYELVLKYNELYADQHRFYKDKLQEMRTAVKNYEHNDLLASLEKIRFSGLTSMDEIKESVFEIDICEKVFKYLDDNTEDNRDIDIANCRACGDLSELISKNNATKSKKKDIAKRLGSLVERHIDKLNDLADKQFIGRCYNGLEETLIEYIDNKHPGFVDDIKKLYGVIRVDWEENSETIIELVEKLYELINEYLVYAAAYEEIEVKKRRLPLSKIVNKLDEEVHTLGYKEIKISELAKRINNILKELENEYDLVDVD